MNFFKSLFGKKETPKKIKKPKEKYQQDLKITFSIYKDKYWTSFERYRQ